MQPYDWSMLTGIGASLNQPGGVSPIMFFSIVPAISWRPTPQSVFRLNYRYKWQRDLLGNPASKLAGIQFGLSTYF